MNPGYHETVWAGKDMEGNQLPSGVYLIRLAGEKGNYDTKKAVMIK
jgi:flagellar hook assembly protein FlgD